MNYLLKVHKFSFNQEETLHFNQETDWIQKILDEVEENIDRKADLTPSDTPSMLEVEVKIQRKFDPKLRDHLILRGTLKGLFYGPCIRCLMAGQEKIDIQFACCFLHPSLEQDEEYRELSEIFTDNQEMELYFYDQGSVNLHDFIRELVYLNKDPLPLHQEDCKGLCPVCGFNLNFGRCIHERQKPLA